MSIFAEVAKYKLINGYLVVKMSRFDQSAEFAAQKKHAEIIFIR